MMSELEQKKTRFDELSKLLADPSVLSDKNEYQKYAKEYAGLKEIVDSYLELTKLEKQLESIHAMLRENDPEIRHLAEQEKAELTARRETRIHALKKMLSKEKTVEDRDLIVEIRAGTGGEEAALFASDLFRMYGKYAEKKGWKTEMISSSSTGIGGFKEVIFSIEGQGAYERLRFDSGTHRVQRVPVTEASGRIHTSTATVVIMPEAKDVEIKLNESDIRVDVFCSSGPGGQSVNTTYSAVRFTHIPTGIVVQCQDERSQLKNKAKAMKVLKARLLEREKELQQKQLSAERKAKIGAGDRSDKIRTYNFPQNRITDHRHGVSVFNLEAVLSGDMDEFLAEIIKKMGSESISGTSQA